MSFYNFLKDYRRKKLSKNPLQRHLSTAYITVCSSTHVV